MDRVLKLFFEGLTAICLVGSLADMGILPSLSSMLGVTVQSRFSLITDQGLQGILEAIGASGLWIGLASAVVLVMIEISDRHAQP